MDRYNFIYDSRKLARRLERVKGERNKREFKEALIITNELGILLECMDHANAGTTYLALREKLQEVRFILTHVYANEFKYGSYSDGIDIEEVCQYQTFCSSILETEVLNNLILELSDKWNNILDEFEELCDNEFEKVKCFVPYISKVMPIIIEISNNYILLRSHLDKELLIKEINYFYVRYDYPLWNNCTLINEFVTHYEQDVRARIQNYNSKKDSLIGRFLGYAPKHPFNDIPLCWIGDHPEGWTGIYVKLPKGKTWYLLLGFEKQNNILYGVTKIYHSAPPDTCLVNVSEIPEPVLAEALKCYQKFEQELDRKNHKDYLP